MCEQAPKIPLETHPRCPDVSCEWNYTPVFQSPFSFRAVAPGAIIKEEGMF
jgi:hypothetical protein